MQVFRCCVIYVVWGGWVLCVICFMCFSGCVQIQGLCHSKEPAYTVLVDHEDQK